MTKRERAVHRLSRELRTWDNKLESEVIDYLMALNNRHHSYIEWEDVEFIYKIAAACRRDTR
jgi:hypothetical protein